MTDDEQRESFALIREWAQESRDLQAKIVRLQDKVVQLTTERDALAAALRPFAELMEDESGHDEAPIKIQYSWWVCYKPMGDFRRAAAALALVPAKEAAGEG